MVLKLYSYFRSTNGLRVALILREKQVPFEFVPVDVVKGEHKDPAYKQNHPFGTISPLAELREELMMMSRSSSIHRTRFVLCVPELP